MHYRFVSFGVRERPWLVLMKGKKGISCARLRRLCDARIGSQLVKSTAKAHRAASGRNQ